MNKLKTLKDLESNMMVFGNEQAINHLLRQEAIKWAKSIKEYALAGDGDIKHYIGQIGFIKTFFNLSEGDLK